MSIKEDQEHKGVKRKAPRLEEKRVGEPPSEMEVKADEESGPGGPKSINFCEQEGQLDQGSEPSENPLLDFSLLIDRQKECILVDRLSRLRRDQCEVAEKRDCLVKRCSELHYSLLNQFAEYLEQIKDIESGLLDSEEKLPSFRHQVEETENELSLIRKKIKLCQERLRDKSERRCEELSQAEIKLKEDFRLSEKRLGEEKEKHKCRICWTNDRNALIMDCMHFQYCSDCLHTLQKANRECPTCSGSIAAVLHCKL